MASEHAETTLLILGMRDALCRERVMAALRRVRGVHDVQVSLFRLTAVIAHEPGCTRERLIRAVMRAGYEVEGSPLTPAAPKPKGRGK